MKILRIAALLTGLATSLLALEDTPENRAKLVKHYLETFPVQDMWKGFERNIESQFSGTAPRVSQKKLCKT